MRPTPCRRPTGGPRPDSAGTCELRRTSWISRASEANVALSQASPFGRLVDEKSVGHVVSHAMSRKLSEQERQEDRARLYAMCPEIALAASRLLAHFRDDLERRLLTLNRTLAQGKEGRADLIQAGEDFRISLMNLIELRKALRRKALELRAHEEIVCTPSFAP